MKQKGAYRIMCLGESTTAGQYPPYLENILNQSGLAIKFSVIDEGIGGTSTELILEQLEFNLDQYHPDMIIAMMGINDKGPYIRCKAVNSSKITRFFESLKTYKLAKLLWLHLSAKTRCRKSEGRECFLGIPDYFAKICFKEVYAESLADYSVRKIIERDPEYYDAYIKLGGLYENQGNFDQAEASFKKAIEIKPDSYIAYSELGEFYQRQGQLSRALALFKKAVEVDPDNDDAYIGLGRFYQNQGQFLQAQAVFQKAVEIDPKNEGALLDLGKLYQSQGDFFLAEASFKKAAEVNPENDKAYGALAQIYKETGRPELEKQYAREADRVRSGYFSSYTANNYHKLKSILDKRGVRLVCVQYPMRSLAPLKQIFEGDEKGIIFVDNEKVFKEAVGKASYKDYFCDMFAGDFGHCTPKGNRLLAENIAKAISKEVFGRQISIPDK